VLVEVCGVDGGMRIKCAVTNKYTGWNSWMNWVTLWDSGFAQLRLTSSASRPHASRSTGW
jgi:hypothetical protein